MINNRSGTGKKLILAWSAVLLLMLTIFILSAQPTEQTNHLSMGLTEKILDNQTIIDENFNPINDITVKLNAIVRKLAHFLLFFAMGILTVFAVRSTKSFNRSKVYLIAALICIAYAFSDEFHQMFVAGRNPVLTDVLIDTAGAIAGIVVYGIIKKISEKRAFFQMGK